MNDKNIYTFRGNSKRQGCYDSPIVKGKKITELIAGEHRTLLGIFDGVLYAQKYEPDPSEKSWFFAYDINDCSLKWKAEVRANCSPPAIADGIVFTGGYYIDNYLYAFDIETGEELWRFNGTYPNGIASPVVSGGDVYIAAGRNLHALDQKTKKKIWSCKFRFKTGPYGMTKGNENLFVAISDIKPSGKNVEEIHAVEINTGEESWKLELPDSTLSIMTFYKGMLYCTLNNGDIYAVDEKSGEVKWIQNQPGEDAVYSGGIAAYNDIIYVSSGYNLFAFDYLTGDLAWQFNSSSSLPASSIANGTIYIGCDEGLFGFDAKSGAEVWKYKKSNIRERIRKPVEIYNGRIYFSLVTVSKNGDFKGRICVI